jgi:hypothetical protein
MEPATDAFRPCPVANRHRYRQPMFFGRRPAIIPVNTNAAGSVRRVITGGTMSGDSIGVNKKIAEIKNYITHH